MERDRKERRRRKLELKHDLGRGGRNRVTDGDFAQFRKRRGQGDLPERPETNDGEKALVDAELGWAKISP